MVVGQYSVVEPDGSLRVVDYFVKPETGFRATINKDAEILARQYAGVGQPVVPPQPRPEQAVVDPFQAPQFTPQSSQVAQDVFRAPQTSLQVTDNFKTQQFRGQMQTPEMKDQFQSPQMREQLHSPQLRDQIQSPQVPQVPDHFKVSQFQSPKPKDPSQSPQFRQQQQSPKVQDTFTRPQFKEHGDLFQRPQFARDQFQRVQVGQPLQVQQLQTHHLPGQVMGQPFTELKFRHPQFSKHHILNPQLRRQPFFDIFHFPPFFKPVMTQQTRDPFQSPFKVQQQVFAPQQAAGTPFSHPTFSKHQFLSQLIPGLVRSQQATDVTRKEQTKEQVHSQGVIKDRVQTDLIQRDQIPIQGTDKDGIQNQQAQQEQRQTQQVHADVPQGQDKKDQLHPQAQGSPDQLRNQESSDQPQRQFSDGVFQNPQSRFQHEKLGFKDFMSMQKQQQQFRDQQGNRSPTMSSVPAPGVALKTSLTMDSQQSNQNIGRPLHLATPFSQENRARNFPLVQTRPESRPRPDHSAVIVV